MSSRVVLVSLGGNAHDAADRLALVVTPDIPALRLLHAALEALSEIGNATDRTTFVDDGAPRPQKKGQLGGLLGRC